MNETPIIGFIGAGRMAAALARGFVDSGLVAPENLIASDPVQAGRKAFGQAVGCETTDSNADLLAKAKVIFLAFKPHQLDEACGGLARVGRVMPNTPALVGEGACGYALGQAATADDGELV